MPEVIGTRPKKSAVTSDKPTVKATTRDVERHVRHARQAAGEHRRHGANRPVPDEQSERAAGEGQHQAFDHQHLEQPVARRAERHAHADLALPARRRD